MEWLGVLLLPMFFLVLCLGDAWHSKEIVWP